MNIFPIITAFFIPSIAISSAFPDLEMSFGDGLLDKEDKENIPVNLCSLSEIEYAEVDKIESFYKCDEQLISCTDTDIIVYGPTKADKHPGNINFASNISANRHLYQLIDQKTRLQIVDDIFNTLKDDKVRFLEFVACDESWHEASDESAKQMIVQSLEKYSVCPYENDIVINNPYFTGNKNLESRIKANQHILQSIDKINRLQIVEDILNVLKEENVRFLEYCGLTLSWRVVSDEVAKKVIAQHLDKS